MESRKLQKISEDIMDEVETYHRTSVRNALVAELHRQSALYRMVKIAEEDHYMMTVVGTVVLDDLADALMLALGRVN
jgi:hypothetical protein